MKSAIVFGAVGLGFLLLLLSLVWPQLFPGSSSWTPEKAEQWAKVKDRLHNLSFVVNAPPGAQVRGRQDLESARAEYDKIKEASVKLQAEFESAYDSPRTTATVLKWTGIGFCALGVVGWYATKEGA